MKATILFAHGSRDPLWRKPVEAIAARVQSLDPAGLVGCAYLELTDPPLMTCATVLIDQGAQNITVVPLFLGVGRHAREDLPVLMAELKAAFPLIAFGLQSAVGEDARLVDLLAHMALEPAQESGSKQSVTSS